MYVRAGYFEGEIAEKDFERFKAHVEREVAPLILKMPGIRDLRILWGREFQDGAPPYVLALEHAYNNKAALEAAIASPARDAMRAKLAEVMPLFKGSIRHVNYDLGFKS
jgi:uncharacterized protein (TIGR02118 family)